MTDDEARRLLEAAREALKHSYAPYSGFRVGAAALSDTGEIIPGCNIENAAYPATICAERAALAGARARGVVNIVAMAVVTDSGVTCVPCGLCRQVLSELAPEAEILVEDGRGGTTRTTVRDLLPMAFGRSALGLKD